MNLPSDPTADAPLQTTPTRHRIAEGASQAALEERILGPLNEVQRRAVTTTTGPLLVLAGAGSGKTRVITHRIAWLIEHEGVAPWRILAVTFTNKAAAEMRARLEEMIGERSRDVAMGTFHSLCVRMLRRDGEAIGLPREFAIYDADDQARVIKGFLKEDDLPATGSTKPGLILGAISRAKNDGLTPDQMEDQAVTHHERLIAGLARRYAAELKRLEALDFDDLLIEGLRLLQEAPAVAERYRTKWQYLHVDEYQDTNRIQYAWIRELAAGHGNLCVVGDDDQSIYSWRGADIRNILDFERDWPKAEVIALEQNYRSTQSILDAAHGVVSNNRGRKAKKLWTDQSGGLPIPVYGGFDAEDEAAWIVRRLEEHAAPRQGRGSSDAEPAESYGGMAILYRTNAQSRAIEEALLRASIPYQLIGGTRFYQRREVKDALDRFIEETALVADQDSIEDESERVTLITMHAAKGLEWPTVFISGLTEGLFPHSRALMDEEQMEEERRLCYVGITRAKRRLTLTYAIRRGWGDGEGVPSRFLAEIPDELLEVANDGDPRTDGTTRFGRGVAGYRSARSGFASGEAWREGSGRPGTPDGPFSPGRDLEAKRRAYGAGARSGSLRTLDHDDGVDAPFADPDHDEPPLTRPIGRIPPWATGRRVEGGEQQRAGTTPPHDEPTLPERTRRPARVRIPGERYFRDGDRVQHAHFGTGVVVTSKLTRSDEEVTIAFVGVGVKTLAASLANLEIV